MKKVILILFLHFPLICTGQQHPIGKPGLSLTYRSVAEDLPGSVVRRFRLALGTIEEKNGVPYQWFQLSAEKENRQTFSVWILSSGYPSESVNEAQDHILRYILSGNDSGPVEYVHHKHGTSILPATGAWKYLLPRAGSSTDPDRSVENRIKYLGHEYVLDMEMQSVIPSLRGEPTVVRLNP
jgi:hypothetical protein